MNTLPYTVYLCVAKEENENARSPTIAQAMELARERLARQRKPKTDAEST